MPKGKDHHLVRTGGETVSGDEKSVTVVIYDPDLTTYAPWKAVRCSLQCNLMQPEHYCVWHLCQGLNILTNYFELEILANLNLHYLQKYYLQKERMVKD